jgi:hypothetical protein
MTIRKYRGEVSTRKVGSKSTFEFEIDDEDLPEDPQEHEDAINDRALEALWESGVIDWSFGEVGS